MLILLSKTAIDFMNPLFEFDFFEISIIIFSESTLSFVAIDFR